VYSSGPRYFSFLAIFSSTVSGILSKYFPKKSFNSGGRLSKTDLALGVAAAVLSVGAAAGAGAVPPGGGAALIPAGGVAPLTTALGLLATAAS
jgi:hypothetical protein